MAHLKFERIYLKLLFNFAMEEFVQYPSIIFCILISNTGEQYVTVFLKFTH